MVHLFLREDVAQDLLQVVRASGDVFLLEALTEQMGRPNPHATVTVYPTLSVWYRGQATHYFDDDLADALFAGLGVTRAQWASDRAAQSPLLAPLDLAEVPA